MLNIKNLSKRKIITYSILLVMLIFIITSSYFTFLSIQAAISSIAVIGIVLISGFARQLHLGQAAFVGLGAYTSAILMTKLDFNFWVTLPIAIIVAVIFGVLLGIPTLKLRGGPYLALVTQTFGEIIFLLLLNLIDLTGGPFGIAGIKSPKIGPIDFADLKMYLFLCLLFMIICYLIARQISKSKFGRIFISIRESEAAAQSVGINTMKYKIMAFSLAAAFGGLSGVLYGPFIGYLSPEQFRWVPSLTLISMAIVGGLSSLEGGILGAFILTFLPEFLRVADQFRLIIYGVVIILTLAFLPNGVISIIGKSYKENKEMISKRIQELSNKSDMVSRNLKQKRKQIETGKD